MRPIQQQPRQLVLALIGACFSLTLTSCDIPAGEDARRAEQKKKSGQQMVAEYRPPVLAQTEVVEVPETGIDLGWGYNTFDAEPVRNICVQFMEKSEPAQTRYMTMHEVSDSYELMQKMGMSAEASVKTIGVEVSGKAAFAKEANVSSFASTFVLNALVENGVRYAGPHRASDGRGMEEIRLTREALAMIMKPGTGTDEFQHLCGNGFVSAVYGGAKLTAVLTQKSSSHAAQEKLAAEMTGSGWGAKFKAKLEKSVKSKNESSAFDLSIFQTGGRGDEIPATEADLLNKLKALPALAYDAPKDFRIAVTPYESLSNWPAKSLTGDENEFEQIASYWGSYNSLYSEFQQVLDEPEKYQVATIDEKGCTSLTELGPTDIDRLQRAQDEVLAGLQTLVRFAGHCSELEEECSFDESQFRSQYAYRVLLPVPKPPDTDKKQNAAKNNKAATTSSAVAIVSEYHLIDPVKRRCEIAPDDPGCMSNAEIGQWSARIGMDFRTLKTAAPDFKALKASLFEAENEPPAIAAQRSCEAVAGKPETAVTIDNLILETRTDVDADGKDAVRLQTLWFHPALGTRVDEILKPGKQ